jgi:hypothetical protein
MLYVLYTRALWPLWPGASRVFRGEGGISINILGYSIEVGIRIHTHIHRYIYLYKNFIN